MPLRQVICERLCFAVSLAAFCGLVTLVGCGGEDLIFPGVPLSTATVSGTQTPGCLASGDSCSVASDCCSGQCVTLDGVNLTCQ